ncbi:tetratricopeptide repeat protein [bacterium]|nr:tetratricopeptide repeat protein [bacterium]
MKMKLAVLIVMIVTWIGSSFPLAEADSRSNPTSQTTVLVLVGEWFGDSYYALEKEIAAYGWQLVRVGVDQTCRGCYLKERNIELNSNILIKDITDFSAYRCLIIPSGPHFRKFVENQEVLEFVRSAYKAGLLIASFCTGNFVVNAAGITDFKDQSELSVTEVTLVKERVLFGPRGGGPPPGSGFAEAPVIDLCQAIAYELGLTHKTSAILTGTVGPYQVGFKLQEMSDPSRSYPNNAGGELTARRIRMYRWYPAAVSEQDKTRMTLRDYAMLAADDFGLMPPSGLAGDDELPPLPIPLEKGLDSRHVKELLQQPVAAIHDAPELVGQFPIVLIGQGLYYEAPFAQYALAEILAGQGYVVVTCPLMGSHYRLVNLNAADLETQVRDLEFCLGAVRSNSNVNPDRIGIVGFDLGGMAGLIMAMRQPEIKALVTLEAGILSPHFSGLPQKHPSYDESKFVIPWLHMTQSRFVSQDRAGTEQILIDRKKYGDSYLVSVPTTSHGAFSAYALFDIRGAINGYWEAQQTNQMLLHQSICRYVLTFYQGYLGNEPQALFALQHQKAPIASDLFQIEFKKGQPPHVLSETLVQLIIDQGMIAARPMIEQVQSNFPDCPAIEEPILNWLGYHFLYWWGREQEAIEVFRLMVDLFPDSSNAYDSLGEAYLRTRQHELALEKYRRALELDPNNRYAEAIIKQLSSN